MIVRCKDRLAPDSVVQMLAYRPGDRNSVVGRRTAPDLIEQYQASPSCRVKNGARFRHLHHEGRLAANQIVACPNPREKAIDDADPCPGCGDETANLRH